MSLREGTARRLLHTMLMINGWVRVEEILVSDLRIKIKEMVVRFSRDDILV